MTLADRVWLAVALLLPAPGHLIAQPQAAHQPATMEACLDDALEYAAREPRAMRFLAHRLILDPLDFQSKNRLASLYLGRLGRSGGHRDLECAGALARSSLNDFSGAMNPGGLSVLTRVELASHQFDEAARHARELSGLLRDDIQPALMLGDALLETGQYSQADEVYGEIAGRGHVGADAVVSVETRLARMAWLRGRIDAADRHMQTAQKAAAALSPGNADHLAWCWWQSGSMAFALGNVDAAEARLQRALAASADYAPALAGLARIRAAQGETAAAIGLYEQAIHRNPQLTFIAALGDLYDLAGQTDRAQALFARAERIGFDIDHVHADRQDHSHAATVPARIVDQAQWPDYHGRDLALFYADHGMKPHLALQIAEREYHTRKDIYTADALAWAALAAGELETADRLSARALRLDTPDPRLHYHAGMIAYARGDVTSARSHLLRTLSLNPYFDPVHGVRARDLYARLSGGEPESRPQSGL